MPSIISIIILNILVLVVSAARASQMNNNNQPSSSSNFNNNNQERATSYNSPQQTLAAERRQRRYHQVAVSRLVEAHIQQQVDQQLNIIVAMEEQDRRHEMWLQWLEEDIRANARVQTQITLRSQQQREVIERLETTVESMEQVATETRVVIANVQARADALEATQHVNASQPPQAEASAGSTATSSHEPTSSTSSAPNPSVTLVSGETTVLPVEEPHQQPLQVSVPEQQQQEASEQQQEALDQQQQVIEQPQQQRLVQQQPPPVAVVEPQRRGRLLRPLGRQQLQPVVNSWVPVRPDDNDWFFGAADPDAAAEEAENVWFRPAATLS